MSTLFPAEIPLRPSAARISNYLLHGKDNFAADREVADKLLDEVPDLRRNMNDHQRFVTRAAAMLASLGFDRFADLGCGIPTDAGMLHAVRQIQPQATFVCVDIDRHAAAYAQAIVAIDDRTEVLAIDVRDTRPLLQHPRIQNLLSEDSSTVVVAAGLLQFLSDKDAAQLIACWRRHLPSAGRFLISHLVSDHTSAEELDALRHAYQAANMEIRVRSAEQVADLFGDGWRWMAPGLVPVERWRPHADLSSHDPDLPARSAQFYGGVAMPHPRDVP